MRRKSLVLAIVLISVVSVSLFAAIFWFATYEGVSVPGFFVGVECAYGNVSDCIDLVDKVRNYTNLFVIGSLDISFNETMLNVTCDYAYDAGLYFIVLFTSPVKYNYNPYVWILKAREKYGDRFLGVYRYDEPGGNQLDNGPSKQIFGAENYTDAAEKYVESLNIHIEYYLYSSPKVFTADYGLYWFDYKAGYNAVLTEFGFNLSRQLNVGLCRGAAKIQNKDWGAIVTWKYNGTPYAESADELYSDLLLAYHTAAKYVVVFDYPKIARYGILTEQHFDAMKRFWNYMNDHRSSYGNIEGEVAYILPEAYGFGFRKADDTIWGLWSADPLSAKIWSDANNLTSQHDSRLDIVYNDPEFITVIKSRYSKLVFWNQTGT